MGEVWLTGLALDLGGGLAQGSGTCFPPIPADSA